MVKETLKTGKGLEMRQPSRLERLADPRADYVAHKMLERKERQGRVEEMTRMDQLRAAIKGASDKFWDVQDRLETPEKTTFRLKAALAEKMPALAPYLDAPGVTVATDSMKIEVRGLNAGDKIGEKSTIAKIMGEHGAELDPYLWLTGVSGVTKRNGVIAFSAAAVYRDAEPEASRSEIPA